MHPLPIASEPKRTVLELDWHSAMTSRALMNFDMAVLATPERLPQTASPSRGNRQNAA